MTNPDQNPAPAPEAAPLADPQKPLSIKVFGIGTAGVNAMENLIRTENSSMSFVAVITDAQSLAATSASDKVHLETRLLRGLGTGGDPERGRGVAEEHFPRLKSLCEGVDVVFLIAGLGGGAGTGISPVLARAAKEAGALVLGFVTVPFECEGSRRQVLAQQGLERLQAAADGVVRLQNQRIFKLIDENTSVLDTFRITNEMLADGVRGLSRLLTHRGLIDIHFSDLCELVRDRHSESAFAVAEAMGPTRSREVTDKLLAHPLLDDGKVLCGADVVMISLMGGPDLTMAEVNRVVQDIGKHCEEAQVMLGAAIDPRFSERLSVTLIASAKPGGISEVRPRPGTAENIDAQLLPKTDAPRHGSRFAAPAPSLSQEQLERLLSRQGGGTRGRKAGNRLRQGQLPLDIIAKGRFDKGEPTIHKGEDLDVPTYVRRGMSLN